MKKIYSLKIYLLVFIFFLTACSETKIITYKNLSYDSGFDTVYSYLENTKKSNDDAQKNFKDSCQLLKHYNDLFDIYHNYDGLNNLKTINDNAGKKAIKVDQSIIDLLKEAKHFYDLSKGEFDITIGSTLKLWHKYREEGIILNQQGKKGSLPTKEELEKTRFQKGWDKIKIDENKKTVFISDPNVSLDVGAIGKGYATELVARAMEKKGVKSGYVNVGRNIRTIGTKPKNEAWTIGVADPDGKLQNGLLSFNKKGSLSFVTSGDYERYYIANDNQMYSHIIDPQTLYPARYYRSVTILTADSGMADAMSTSLFTLSIKEGKELIKRIKKESGKEINAIWVMERNKVQDQKYELVDQYAISYTDGLNGNITLSK